MLGNPCSPSALDSRFESKLRSCSLLAPCSNPNSWLEVANRTFAACASSSVLSSSSLSAPSAYASGSASSSSSVVRCCCCRCCFSVSESTSAKMIGLCLRTGGTYWPWYDTSGWLLVFRFIAYGSDTSSEYRFCVYRAKQKKQHGGSLRSVIATFRYLSRSIRSAISLATAAAADAAVEAAPAAELAADVIDFMEGIFGKPSSRRSRFESRDLSRCRCLLVCLLWWYACSCWIV
mmetsp:Transcript_7138/g.13196  ORF Transcript_7138/g.13196 Transcript_7138/m.13196 type:complete len:234 (+) Transcript_7138:332-1033(+)